MKIPLVRENLAIGKNKMIKINIGCGWRNFGPGWVHIDGGDYEHLDSNNIINLPYGDEEVDLIYASHVLEYFDREEVNVVLEEWYRVLKPGATLRIAVPNFESIVNIYRREEYSLDSCLGLLYGKMPMGKEIIYHKTTYDFESLTQVLGGCGFRHMKLYNCHETEHANFDDHSQAYLPHMNKKSGILMSLNVECVR